MRTELKKLEGERKWFHAHLAKLGMIKHSSRGGYVNLPTRTKQKALLLQNVKSLRGDHIAHHTWIEWSRGFEGLGMNQEIIFLATVTPYKTGEVNYGFKSVVWPQKQSKNPVPLPLLEIPQSKEEADSLLLKLFTEYGEHAGFSRSFRQWDFKLLRNLVMEGWGNFSPSHFEYEASKSPAFSALCKAEKRDSEVVNYCQVASYINGYQPVILSS